MKAGKVTLLLLILAALPVSASGKTDKEACEKVKQQIRAIQSRMRNGYSAAQGIRLDERMRELKDKRYKLCR
jgi:hypothetical protein